MRATLAAEGSAVAALPRKPPSAPKEKMRAAPVPDWAETAYRLWCRGQKNWSELGRQFGVERRTVQSVVRKFAQAVVQAAEGEGIIDAYNETVIGYEEIIATCWQEYAACKDNRNAKAAFLKLIEKTMQDKAALQGVVTQRVAIVDETPKPLDDQPLEVLVRIAQNGHVPEEEDGEG